MPDDSKKEMNEELRIYNNRWCLTKTSLLFENHSEVRSSWITLIRGTHVDFVLINESLGRFISDEDYHSVICPLVSKKKGEIISFSTPDIKPRKGEKVTTQTT